MSTSAERGNFEGRSRAHGGFGNESGQTDRRGRSGEAERANRDAMNRAAARSAPPGPFKSPTYDATLDNLVKLGKMVGPMLANPGIGLAAPLARSILSGDPYGAFGRPTGWSSYSPRDINPMGSNPRGNIGGRDTNVGIEPRHTRPFAALEEMRHRQESRPKPSPHPAAPLNQYMPPSFIFDQVPGLPFYGVSGPTYAGMPPRHRKASGYGGTARPSPIPFPESQ